MVQGFQLNKVRKPHIDDYPRNALLKLWESIQHAADEHVTRQAAYKIEVNRIYQELQLGQ